MGTGGQALGGAQVATGGSVLIRFSDDELIEGNLEGLDLDRPDFEVLVGGAPSNSPRALVAFPAVKCITLQRESCAAPLETAGLQKVALRFRDGEVVRGLLRGEPRRGRFGMAIELVSPDGAEVELMGIPYDSLKAVFYLSSWDSRPADGGDDAGEGSPAARRAATPLVELLADINRLAGLRDRGEIGREEFMRRRAVLLDMM